MWSKGFSPPFCMWMDTNPGCPRIIWEQTTFSPMKCFGTLVENEWTISKVLLLVLNSNPLIHIHLLLCQDNNVLVTTVLSFWNWEEKVLQIFFFKCFGTSWSFPVCLYYFEFTELLGCVNWCFSSNLGRFGPLFLQICF